MTEAEKFLAENNVAPGCRWTALRKAALLTAMRRWPDESVDLMQAHGVSDDKAVEWNRASDLKGLRAASVRPAEERVDVVSPPPQRRRSAPGRPVLTDPWRER